MKRRNKTIVYAALAVVLLLVIAAVCLYWWIGGKSGYLRICKFDFDNAALGYSGLGTSSYHEDAAEFLHSQKGGIDGSGCIMIRSKEADDARFTYRYEKAKENTYYRMSVWVRTEGMGSVSGEVPEGAVGANVSVLNTFYHSTPVNEPYQDWTYIEYYGKTGRGQTDFTVALRLGFYSAMNSGTVYFDDFELEQLDSLPEGAVSYSMRGDMGESSADVQAAAEHRDTMLAATAIVIAILLGFIVAYRYAVKRDREVQQLDLLSGTAISCGLSTQGALIWLIVAGFVLRIVLSFTMPQCDIDVNLFQAWARNLAGTGIPDFYSYAEEMHLDYPPLFLYYLYPLGLVGNVGNIAQTAFFDVLLKLPSILADCMIAYLLYKMAAKRMSKSWILFLVSLWLFNPMVLLDSACWGQVDSILALALLFSAYCLEKDRYVWASVALAFAVTLKPQGIFFVPVLGFALLRQLIREKELSRKDRLLRFVYCIGAFFVTAFLIILPFGLRMEPNLFSWVIDLYTNTADGYSYATVNSFNFFYLLDANWVQDSSAFLGLTYFAWGMIAIVLFSLLTGVLYLFSEKKHPYAYLLSAVLIYTVATFGPRMHERYFYPALVLLLAAIIYSNNKLLLGIYAVMSLSNFYTVLEVMTGLSLGGKWMEKDPGVAGYYYWPPLNTERALMATLNVLCAVALTAVACWIVFTKNRGAAALQIWEETDEIYFTNGDQYEETEPKE